MQLRDVALCLACASAITAGQVLIKLAADRWNVVRDPFDAGVLGWLASSFLVYALASIGWMYLLKQLPLSRIYPFLSLSFVLVPIAGIVLFGEEHSAMIWLACALIVSGIILSATA